MLLFLSIFAVAEFIKNDSSNLETSYKNEVIAHWEFNEKSGNMIYDSSGNGFHGTILGNPEWTNGKIDDALEFDANGDYISISQNTTQLFSRLSKLGQGSISVWFRVDYIPVEHGIMPIFYYGSKNPCDNFFDAANQGLIIEVGHSPIHQASKRIYFTIWANGCTYPSFCFDSRNSINEGEWYHFVAVVGPDNNTGYLNGEEMVNRRYNFGNSHYSQFFEDAVIDEALWFGRGYWDAKRDPSPVYLDGAIDDIRILSKPLSSEEVAEIYQEGSDNNPPLLPSITGPSDGRTGEVYDYIISTIDPDSDDVFFWVEWFVGCPVVEWDGPHESGEEIIMSNTWDEQGTYDIRVTAKDTFGAMSDTATHTVRIPKRKMISNHFENIFNFIKSLI
jgi:hypothetical protein